MQDHTGIEAVVISYRARDYLERCLKSIDGVAQITRTVVVDNASGDGTAEWLERHHSHKTLIANLTNLGFAAAANQGCQTAQSEFLLLLNNDVEVNTLAVVELSAALRADDRTAATCARLVTEDGKDQLGHGERPKNLRWAPGACLLLRRSALTEVGWFDREFFFYNEDVDLGIRLRRANWRIRYVPGARVLHHEGKSTDAVRWQTIVHGYRGGLRLIAKHYPWLLGLARVGIRLEIRYRALWCRGRLVLGRSRAPVAKVQAFMDALPDLLKL